MIPDRLYIYGAGGAGREIAWLAHDIWPKAELTFLVEDPKWASEPVNGIPVRLLADLRNAQGAAFVVALGDAGARERGAAACVQAGLRPTSLVHPRADISSWVEIGAGAIVCAGSVVTTNVKIGAHVYVNVGCTVSHDVVLEDFATLSPGVHLAGNVHVGRGAFLGIGASVIHGRPGEPVVIGSGAVVAGGACVTQSVPAGAMVAGVPATIKRA